MAEQQRHAITVLLTLGLFLGGVADAELVGWWKLDGNAADSSGQGHDGVLYGGPTWTEGMIGGALKFDGVDDRVEMPGTSAADGYPNLAGEITWAMWIKAPASAATQAFMTLGPAGGAHVQGNRSVNVETSGVLMVRAHSVAALTSVSSKATVNDDQWHHIAVTLAFDTSGTNDTMKVYIDGDLSKGYTVDNVNINQYATAANGFIITLGYRASASFGGALDDVRIFNHVLTEDEIRVLVETHGEPYPFAYGPTPADGAMIEQTFTTLKWMPGDFASSHRMYFGTNPADVNAATPESQGVFLGATTAGSQMVGLPQPLVPGTTYYWRVDEVSDTNPASPWKGDIWSFWVRPAVAWNPAPANKLRHVSPDQKLSWAAGLGNLFHTVYFGTSVAEVNDATTGGAMLVNAVYGPTLEVGRTYFWRVDEFDGFKTHKGDVWSFTTVPDVPVADPDLLVRWTLDEAQGATAVDWSGHGHHGTVAGDAAWIDGYAGGALRFDGINDQVTRTLPAETTISTYTVTAWVKADRVGQAQYASVFNNNSNGADFQIDVDGASPGNYRYMGTGANALMGPVARGWVHLAVACDGTTTSLYYNAEPVETAATADTLFGQFALGVNRGMATFFAGAIDDARVYRRVLTENEIAAVMRVDARRAGDPVPERGAIVDIRDAKSLSWLAGDTAASHDVYLGTNRDAVAGAGKDAPEFRGNRASGTLSLSGLVAFGGGDYYWRIDEVEADGTIHTGDVWKFSIPDFLIVDDFESYTDAEGERIYETWIDGWTNKTGSQVGNLEAPFAELTVVNGGGQSMPLAYDNATAPGISEADRTFAPAQDWTANGVTTLIVHFRGMTGSTGQLYVKINGTKVPYGGAATDIAALRWTVWKINLAATGVNVAAVRTLTIGIEGGSGKVYFDDIRLTKGL